MTEKSSLARIAICMGSQSDWSTMKAAADILDQFGTAHEVKIISAHRTPARDDCGSYAFAGSWCSG